MNKKKQIIGICIGLCLVLVAAAVYFLQSGKEDTADTRDTEDTLTSFAQVKEVFPSEIQALKDGKYENLIPKDFNASIEAVEGVYTLEILSDNSYQDRTFLENFAIMDAVIDKFFQEDFDKSFIKADFNISGEVIYVDYDDIEKECADDKYNMPDLGYLFGDIYAEGGYMVQISESLVNTWFSKYGLGDKILSQSEGMKVYPYLSCIRQGDDIMLNLLDGEITLSQMEENVLDYLNTDKFPLPKSEGITYGIADVRVLENGDYDGVCFKVRRIYEGIPFEYGEAVSSGIYISQIPREISEISYAESTAPDTMLGFGRVNGTVVETETITEMLTVGEALDILSEEIGDNSVYEVHGVELVYRNCIIPEEREQELDDILTPRWKIITVNQNDDKYTLFYIDVVTGEITERFEYYYD